MNDLAPQSDQEQRQSSERACWICLGTDDDGDGPLRSFCACPDRPAHERCLARWCLQQAGRAEEKRCRFCAHALPDYKSSLVKREGTASSRSSAATAAAHPNMRVHYGNVTIVMPLKPGEGGRREFEAGVKQLLGLPESQTLNINFKCKEPGSASSSGSHVQLAGIDTYDAAFWCASLTAAERHDQQQAIASATSGASTTGFGRALSAAGFGRAASMSGPQPRRLPPAAAAVHHAQSMGHMQGQAVPLLYQQHVANAPHLMHSQSVGVGGMKRPGFFSRLFGLNK